MMTFDSIPYSGSRLDASIELAQKLADQWGTHALMIQMARDITRDWHTNGRLDESKAIQDWVKRRVRYVPDPIGAEMMADPLTTLKNGGDCDDQAILSAALLQAIGHDARVGAVTWKGRTAASHCIVVDLTAGCVVDPVGNDPEIWPPAGYEVQVIKYLDKQGQMQSMNGLFSKLVKAVAKPFQKIFPAKTVLGKIMDPLGLTDPKRNLNLAGRVADVVGTAAAVVAGGYALGAYAAGTAAAGSAAAGTTGFWSTAALGASTAGNALLAAGKVVGGGLLSAAGKVGGALAATALTSALLPKPSAPVQTPDGVILPGEGYMNPDQAAAWGGLGAGGGIGYSGGGGGGGAYAFPDGASVGATTATSYAVPIAAAAILGIVLLSGSKRKNQRGKRV